MLTVQSMQTADGISLLYNCSRKVGAHIKSAVGNASEKCAEKCVLIFKRHRAHCNSQLCVCMNRHAPESQRLLRYYHRIPWQYTCAVSCSVVKSCIVKTHGVRS